MQSPSFEHQSRRLRSIPGLGPLPSMVFLLEVGDVRRFKSFDALNRYVGLCPDLCSSGWTQKSRSLNVRHNHQLRPALVKASWQLITKGHSLLDHYKELTKRMKGQAAIIRTAKKLLRRMRAVLLSEQLYVNAINEPLTVGQIQAAKLTETNKMNKTPKTRKTRKQPIKA